MDLTLTVAVLAFVLGTVIGSFLNVVILRHPKNEPLTGRSHCMRCKHTLAWYELVPVLSYLMQLGKCRHCSAKVSLQYPLVEVLTGTVFVLVVLGHGLEVPVRLVDVLMLALSLALWSLLIVIAVHDLMTKRIPDRFSYAFALLALLHLIVGTVATAETGMLHAVVPPTFFYTLLTGPVLFLPFYLLWKVSGGRWIGLGDGKLAVGIGWLLGPLGGASALMFGFWIGAVVALALIAAVRVQAYLHRAARPQWMRRATHRWPLRVWRKHHTLTLQSAIPLGPFLVLGTALVYFTDLTAIALVATVL